MLTGTMLQRFSCGVSFFLKSVFFVVLTIFTDLNPIGRCSDGARAIQVRHCGDAIVIRLV